MPDNEKSTPMNSNSVSFDAYGIVFKTGLGGKA